MNNIKLAIVLLVASSILLALHIYNLCFYDAQNGNYFGILSSLLLMFSMFLNNPLGVIIKNVSSSDFCVVKRNKYVSRTVFNSNFYCSRYTFLPEVLVEKHSN